MSKRPILWPALAGLATLAAVAALFASGATTPALAQPSPVPQECRCSAGVNLAGEGAPVFIRHCQCGMLSCAVVVPSGELQCVR